MLNNNFKFSFFYLRYIYTHDFSVKTLQLAEKLLGIGTKYQVASIETDCETFLIKHLKNFVTSEVHDFAKKYKMDELSRLCSVVSDQDMFSYLKSVNSYWYSSVTFSCYPTVHAVISHQILFYGKEVLHYPLQHFLQTLTKMDGLSEWLNSQVAHGGTRKVQDLFISKQ